MLPTYYQNQINKIYHYDVVIAGGGPAGICAAVSAARAGAETLLVERFGILGGMLTSGHVDPILGSVSKGTMYDEIVGLLTRSHPGIPPQVTRNGVEQQVDPEEAKMILSNLLRESGAEYFLQSAVVDAIKEENQVKGVIITTPAGLAAVYGKCLVDCTGDGYLAAQAGAEYLVGREKDGECQPSTIEFVIDHVDETRAITCYGGSDPVKLADGRGYVELCKKASQSGELPDVVSVVRLHRTFYQGERSVNATQANHFDLLSLNGIAAADLELRNQIDKILRFLRTNIPGFENCRVKSSASALGVRETRRIMGEYIMQDADVEKGSRFEDVLVHNAWFLIDIHNPTGPGQAEKFSHPAQRDVYKRQAFPQRRTPQARFG